MKKVFILSMAFLLLALVPAAFADTFTLQSYTVTLNANDPGLTLKWSDALTTKSFNMTLGTPITFDLFKMWTNETSVDKDDKSAKPITVNFTFDPPASSGHIDGTTKGESILFGFYQDGKVTWNAPTVVDFANGGKYTFGLSNAKFNGDYLHLDPGQCDGATIQATLTETMAPTPEPGSLLLLGTGFAGLAGVIRRRFKA